MVVSIAGNLTGMVAAEEQKSEEDIGHYSDIGSITQVLNELSAGRAGDVGQT